MPYLLKHRPRILAMAALLAFAGSAGAAIGTRGSASTEVVLITNAGNQNPKHEDGWGPNSPPQPGWHRVAESSSVLGGNEGMARFEADLGLLKAYASATFSSRQQPDVYGGAYGQAGGSFSDEWLIQAPGLADGTPLQLNFTIHIDGSFSSVRTQYGTPLLANAAVNLVAQDQARTIGTQYFNWDGLTQPVGDYTWSVNTAVGHTLELTAQLSAIGRLDNFATTDTVYADFGHTVRLVLAPPDSGVSTVSLGGHDYALSAVPEPKAWLMVLAGLLGGLAWRRPKTLAGQPTPVDG